MPDQPTPTGTAVQPPRCLSSRKEIPIDHNNITPIVITGGATLAVIIAVSRRKQPSHPTDVTQLTNAKITSHFVAAIPEITPELNLELATATQIETFTKTSICVLWDWLDLGTSTAQIRVPVTYRYHLCLREPWRLEIQHQRVIVHAPKFRASLPPAIHTDKLEKLSVRGWARGGTAELLEQTQREITPRLIQHAGDPRHLELVRAQCRESVAEFVRLWLEREGQWGAGGITEIQVKFPEELSAPMIRQLH